MRIRSDHRDRAARGRWAGWLVMGLLVAGAIGALVLLAGGSSAAASGNAAPAPASQGVEDSVKGLLLTREALIFPLLLGLLAAGMVLGRGNDSESS